MQRSAQNNECESVSDSESLHHVAELFKLDLSVVVLVDLFKQLAQDIVLVLNAQGFLQLVLGDRSAAVFVKQTESRFQLLLTYQVSFVHCGHYEFSVVY